MADLTVTNVKVQEVASFGRDMTTVKKVRYTFYVGQHGPFTLEYLPGQDTPEKVKLDMQAQVDKLTQLPQG